MPKSANQKLKLLFLEKILREQTDEEHTLTVAQLIAELARYGIQAERKTVYDDIRELMTFGADIVACKEKSYGYYLAGRTFELAELKLLADAVASSKFITEKKSAALIKKIESLTSVHHAGRLRRQVYVADRVKTLNERIYYNVDEIHRAIALEKQIVFRYFDIGLDKKKHYRDGYRVASPYALSWDDENYYLIGYYEKYGVISHFRVDRMESIRVLEERRVPPPKEFDLAAYMKKVFSMFGGEEQTVKLRFDNALVGVVFDKFGKNVSVIKADEHSFYTCNRISVSPSFFGWLFQFGDKVSIIGPESVREAYLNALDEARATATAKH